MFEGPTMKGSIPKRLYYGKLHPYSQALDEAGKACQGKTL
jgi:hypothetical protein